MLQPKTEIKLKRYRGGTYLWSAQEPPVLTWIRLCLVSDTVSTNPWVLQQVYPSGRWRQLYMNNIQTAEAEFMRLCHHWEQLLAKPVEGPERKAARS